MEDAVCELISIVCEIDDDQLDRSDILDRTDTLLDDDTSLLGKCIQPRCRICGLPTSLFLSSAGFRAMQHLQLQRGRRG